MPGIALVTATLHLVYLYADTRVPRDLGLYYSSVPLALRAMSGTARLEGGPWGRLLLQPTGWYNVVQAGCLRVFGRSPDAFQVPDVLAATLIVLFTGWIARRLGGDRAGAIAAALVASMPGVVVAARTSWLHVPEAALALGAVVAWMADPLLRRWRTPLIVGVCVALGLALRPSGLVWMGSLGLLPLASVWLARRAGEKAPWGKVALTLGVAALVLPIPLRNIQEYLGAKAAARERYATTLPDLGLQVKLLFGGIPTAALAAALGMRLGGRVARTEDPARAPALLLLGAWVVGALVLWAGFQAGIDNFTLLCPALAALAAVTLAARPRLGLAVALAAWIPFAVMQFVPAQGPDALTHRVPGLRDLAMEPHLLNQYRAYSRFGAPEVRDLVSATCGERAQPRSCVIVADQGLYQPFGEEPGHLELFLAGEERVRLENLRMLRSANQLPIAALAEFHCGERDIAWRLRWPTSLPMLEQLTQAQDLRPVWALEVGPGCTFVWFTPAGMVKYPDHLPLAGHRVAPGDPLGAPPQGPPQERR